MTAVCWRTHSEQPSIGSAQKEIWPEQYLRISS